MKKSEIESVYASYIELLYTKVKNCIAFEKAQVIMNLKDFLISILEKTREKLITCVYYCIDNNLNVLRAYDIHLHFHDCEIGNLFSKLLSELF